MANYLPVQKLRNLIEKIRDKESRIASRRREFSARFEEITSSSTRHLRPPCVLRCPIKRTIHFNRCKLGQVTFPMRLPHSNSEDAARLALAVSDPSFKLNAIPG